MMTVQFSARVGRITPPASLRMAERVRQLVAQGRTIIDLTIGEPDLPTPPAILEAASRAMRDGATRYTSSRGIVPLREAIAQSFWRKHQIKLKPEDIVVTPGAKQAIAYALLALLDDGDEVLIPEPCWLSYRDLVLLPGARPVAVPSAFEGGFLPDMAGLEAWVTERTKLLILNNPVNPTGAVWSDKTLEGIAEFCSKHNVVLLQDQIYEDIVFDGRAVHPILPEAGSGFPALVVNGFSKTFSMTGFRIGYIAATGGMMENILKLQEQFATCASSVSQAAAIAAAQMEEEQIRVVQRVYQDRRDAVLRVAKEVGVRVFRAGGTFYNFVDVGAISEDAWEAGERLLMESGVASVPGPAYGQSGAGFIRLSLVQDIPVLEEAIRRIGALGGNAPWNAGAGQPQ
ncbi:MAG: aminotransferase class I/II-fold pyridoxal phosphate-dependent enzyme [Candidatus Hydrogenedentes bacterium]|nr:aminotransferase class I/II-fold pyridoxal phosphate-dependent enzyme [Candidatus Hydrogenedentota bacterium]